MEGPKDLVIDDTGLSEIDRLLTVTGLADGGDWKGGRPENFDGFEPISPRVNFHELYMFGEEDLRLVPNLDVCWSAPVLDVKSSATEEDYALLVRVRRRLPPKATRLPRLHNAISINTCGFNIGDEEFFSREAWCWAGGRRLHRLGPGQPVTEREQRAFVFGLSLAFDRRYRWSVLLKNGGGPSVRLVTDSIGAHEAIRLRDVPNGKKRRQALLHWVSAHWRRRRSETASRSWIEKHLRGAEVFSMQGYSCRVEPSAVEVESLLR